MNIASTVGTEFCQRRIRTDQIFTKCIKPDYHKLEFDLRAMQTKYIPVTDAAPIDLPQYQQATLSLSFTCT